jgi:NAD dependent epimerase/dehydratase family
LGKQHVPNSIINLRFLISLVAIANELHQDDKTVSDESGAAAAFQNHLYIVLSQLELAFPSVRQPSCTGSRSQTASTSSTLSSMPTIFLTGGTGFVGATVIDQLLAQGHNIIAAVRSTSSGEKLLSTNPSWDKSRLELFQLSDFSQPGAFDNVFKNHPEINYVIHVAAPVLPEGLSDFVEHYEKPNVQGTIGILEAAHEYGPNMKAIAVTGSLNAMTLGTQDDIKDRVFDNTSWLTLGREDAVKAQHQFVGLSNPIMNLWTYRRCIERY